MFDVVLVANRGEIALRVVRTLTALGVHAVAVYSDADAAAPHVAAADSAVRLGPEEPALSYLSVERVVDAAVRTGAQALHPGYGFLSENPALARACADAGVVFVGPRADVIETMGDKVAAKTVAEAAGVPVVPGVHGAGMDEGALLAAADDLGYPLLVKAAAGGGGRGMRVVGSPAGLPAALAAARREASAAFGDGTVFLERFVATPRHLEVQVVGDTLGAVVHLGERECSLQRRHQKIVEECPSPLLDEAGRARLGEMAVEVARAVDYTNAGTVEFLADGDHLAFLEMNTRLQVEHPVTEKVYGVDLVEWQLRVSAGEPLPLRQEDLRPRGHAVEARVYAEDPGRGFLPTGGRLLDVHLPEGPGVRVDTGVATGGAVGSRYDPLLAKVIAYDAGREGALRRLRAALRRCALLGVVTNLGFLTDLLAQDDVRAGRLDTALVERHAAALPPPAVPDVVLASAALHRLLLLAPVGPVVDPFALPGGWRLGEAAWARWQLECGGRTAEVAVQGTAGEAHVRVDGGDPVRARAAAAGADLLVWYDGVHRRCRVATDGPVTWIAVAGTGVWACTDEAAAAGTRPVSAADPRAPLAAPLPGTVTAVHATAGATVRSGDVLVVVEAMKMEHAVTAVADGTVAAVHVGPGDRVEVGQVLAVVDPAS